MRNIETGEEAHAAVNTDTAKDVGTTVLQSMVGHHVLDYSCKKAGHAVTMTIKSTVKVDGDAIHVDPKLLFQRLMAAPDRLVENQEEIFTYELCSFPSAFFETSGLPREADKPSLANAIWSVGDCSMEENSLDESTHYVLDGGLLIQRLPWAHGSTFEAICSMYAEYIVGKYTNATVVFDGYNTESSTKDCAYLRRTHGISSAQVKFNANTPFKSKKDQFLSNCKNKQTFINMLGKCLQERGIGIEHVAGDADVLIVTTAVDLTETQDVVIIGEDTDLLILMCYKIILWKAQGVPQ